ncbi:MAG TPA: response regulator, partial [Spirochaetota bacterium]|nr:response regulator [Spirochaetota bacterium]
MNAPETPTVVVVDDDEAIRYALQKKLTRFGLKIVSLDKAEDALFLLKNPESAVDLVVTDIKLRKMDGIELLRHINILERPVPVLIITGQGNIEDAIRALRYGARDFIRKPFDINEVASIVRRILRSEQEKQLASAFGKYIRSERRSYVIPVDPGVIDVMSYELTRNLMPFGLCNYTASENVALALQEAISNAMFHGNLEIDSA